QSDSQHHLLHHLPPPPCRFVSPATHIRQLLTTCAELISRADFAAAHRLIAALSASSSPNGDSTERLAHQFTTALSLRLRRLTSTACHDNLESSNEALFQSSFLSLNQITPFIRFCHLTANQAILEAVEGQSPAIHIVDFNIMHGVQWPPLMQAIAERYPPPALRITATGEDLVALHRTGDRLAKFAHSLGLRFQFNPITLQDNDPAAITAAVLLLPYETLAVNCVLYLHQLLRDWDRLRLFLHIIKAMNPKVVTVAEREANHNHPVFMHRFTEALDHYTAVFDSLEATVPPGSRERLAVERVWFGREITDVVAAEGDCRRERHERWRTWEATMTGSGFRHLPLSPFALSQAKLLLRLHYPCEGYQIHLLDDCFFLGWQNQLLFSVSSWQ
ncbi:hypothetical protein NMG60_11001999, partial [Bertholletia excelsa]